MQTAVGVHTACASEEVSDKEREEENLKKKRGCDWDTKMNLLVCSKRQTPWQPHDNTKEEKIVQVSILEIVPELIGFIIQMCAAFTTLWIQVRINAWWDFLWML